MRYLRVKNWTEFQHYKDRNPPWIKLHRALLDDYEFSRLQDASKAHLLLIWLFASQHEGGVPDDPKFLQKKLGLDKEPDLESLVSRGFLIPEQIASTSAEQDASKLVHREETYKATYKASEESKGRAVALPDWLPSEPWSAWLEVRSKNRAPNTARALRLAITELAKLKAAGQDVTAVLEQSTLRGWRGVFPVKSDSSSPIDFEAMAARLEAEEKTSAGV